MVHSDFWIGIGDLHGETANIAAIPDLEKARGVLVSGDLTIKGGAAEARRVLQAVTARNRHVLAQIGNMDTPEVDGMLDMEGWNIHVQAMELTPAEESLPSIGLMAVGASTPTPFNTPSEVSENQLGAWLREVHEALLRHPVSFGATLLVVHTPPFDTETDKLPNGQHVGSTAVREFIERVQPDVCLTGHIHESRALCNIGRTVIINPGPLADGGYARIERSAQGITASLKVL